MKYSMILFTLSLVMFSCSHKLAPDQQWAGRKWVLIELNGKEVPSDAGNQIYLEFHSAEKRAGGNGGCNGIGGSYTMDASGALMFGNFISTKMACPKLDTENEFLAAIEKVDSYTLKNGELWLKQQDQVIIKMK